MALETIIAMNKAQTIQLRPWEELSLSPRVAEKNDQDIKEIPVED